jgi:hypothetical protein
LQAKSAPAVEVLPERDAAWTGYVTAWREGVAKW